jgi:hypothetical protein
MIKVDRISFVYDNISLESIQCSLGKNRYFDIEISEFYFNLVDKDKNLYEYSKKFFTWNDLTNDLLSLEFPFEFYCEKYINTEFTLSEIEEFTYCLV